LLPFSAFSILIYMNAKILEKMISYREIHRIELAKLLLLKKIKYQSEIIKQRKLFLSYRQEIIFSEHISELLLIEARAAKNYWKYFGEELGNNLRWKSREPHVKDSVNILLDIGYHYLTGRIIKICNEIGLPTELGMFHKAQSRNAHPFAYDFMEWLRPIVVDKTLMAIVHKKKKSIETVDQKLISLFIFHIKKKLQTYYFHRKLGYGITLEYWIRLLLLDLLHSIDINEKYSPIFPSLRNESRCKNKKPLQ
jgi:CRISPR-associated endonuclease Cas1